jgi:hypothetical protein
MGESDLPVELAALDEGLDEAWQRAVLERAWWTSAAQRDVQAADSDSGAREGDRRAGDRDRAAEQRDDAARERDMTAVRKSVAAIKRLTLADRRDAQRWADSLAAVDAARVHASEEGSVAARAALHQAEDASEQLITGLLEASLERDEVRTHLQRLSQYLLAAAGDRSARAQDRALAAGDRQTAASNRDTALTGRQQAALERAEENHTPDKAGERD